MEQDQLAIEAESDTVPRVAAVDTVDAVLVEEELLVEEISIDGMCGVY